MARRLDSSIRHFSVPLVLLILLVAHVPRMLGGAERSGVTVGGVAVDRKSTRLNSSHPSITYDVFCLKKKNESGQLLHDGCEATRIVHVRSAVERHVYDLSRAQTVIPQPAARRDGIELCHHHIDHDLA